MPYTESAALFEQLPAPVRQYFYNVAAKSDMTAQQVFHYEIPDVLKSDPEGITLLLNGGDIAVATDGFPGPGPGELSDSTTTVEMPDRDFSRIQSGNNGGEYTQDNVVLEDSSINRSRQATDMTDAEVNTAEVSLDADADLIAERIPQDVADITVSVTETSTHIAEDVAIVAETSGSEILETVLEGVLPVTIGAKMAHTAWKKGADAPTTALAGGLGVAATYAVVANPVGAACVAIYGTYKLATLAGKLWSKYA
jgi:hypothetical protein